MPKFGLISQSRLATCDGRLQAIMNEVIKVMDIAVICGFRDQEAQDRAVAEGKSKTPWPTSKHNSTPSLAVDIAPYPIDWDDIGRFQMMGGVVLAVAHMMGIPVRWGASWQDFPHFELIDPKPIMEG